MANTITGNFKVFKRNFLVSRNNTITASSGNTTTGNLKDFDRLTKWVSVGSADDGATVTIDIVWDTAQTIDRIMLIGMNFKYFSVFYWDGSAWANFANVYDVISASESLVGAAIYGAGLYGTGVYGLSDDAKNGIFAVENTDTTKYFEFDSVSTLKVRIETNKTITADQEKEMTELYIGTEIGTFIDDITSTPSSYDAVVSETRSRYIEKSNGGIIKYQRADKYRSRASMREMWETTDQDIVNTIFDDGQIAILPNGAVPYVQRGWRLQDLYNVIAKGNLTGNFSVGRVAAIGMDYKVDFQEE